MSSIRNEQMTISQGDLDILDDFMKQLGAVYCPGYNNNVEGYNSAIDDMKAVLAEMFRSGNE